MATKKQVQETNEDETEEVEPPVGGFIIEPNLRMLSLYGDLNEKRGSEIVYSLLAYKEVKRLIPKDPKKPKGDYVEIIDPLEFIISTNGGSAPDMFAIYDTMNMVKPSMPIHTMGLGKVMSAGVLLLATGTKGKRRIGRNCRVMIHAVQAGAGGSSHDIINEVEEIMFTQDRYIQALSEQTKLSPKKITQLIDEKRNIYISAEEAVKYGIADIVV